MKIRRYMGKNTQEAILKVKMDLGNDALILNTRKVKQKGLFGIFAKPLVEVLAAIDEYNSNKKEDLNNKIKFDEKEEKIATLENKINNMEEMLHKIYGRLELNDKTKEGNNGNVKEVNNDNVKDNKQHNLPKISQIFYNNLVKSEVEVDIAKKLIDGVIAKAGDVGSVNDTASVLFNIISGFLGKPETIQQRKDGRPTVVIFVGPTGVGKTTTLAKIAANYLLNQKKTIGLITADTYRIAAVEQLKTYAEILGIPVSVVYTPNDVRDAVSQHSDKDLILIDTAGRSSSNKAQFEELKSLIKAAGADEIYLVLSATTSTRNCSEIMATYGFLKDYKLIFTKIDETPVYGVILNVKYLTGKNLSYITTGQSVPDDIETANIEKITKNLIGSIA